MSGAAVGAPTIRKQICSQSSKAEDDFVSQRKKKGKQSKTTYEAEPYTAEFHSERGAKTTAATANLAIPARRPYENGGGKNLYSHASGRRAAASRALLPRFPGRPFAPRSGRGLASMPALRPQASAA